MESVKLQVQVVRDQLNKLQEDVNSLQGKTLKITVDASGLEALDKSALRALKSSNDLAIAQEKTAQANAKAAAEASKAAAAQAKQAAEAEKTAQAEARAAAETEKTAQANAKAAAEAEKTAQANAKVAAETEKTAQAQAKLAAQQERTNTVQAQAALQTERTATANVQLATQQERSVTSAINLEAAQTRAAAAAERGAAAQRMQNDAMREGDPLARLLGNSLEVIVAKMAAWQVIGTVVSTVIRSFREAIDTMKEVDSQLTTIQKVTNRTAEDMERLGNAAYGVASSYGVTASEYLENVAAFARAGYGDMSEAAAELAIKTQLVGDTTAEMANRFLISIDAAYDYQHSIEALSDVLDKANTIENTQAVSLAQLAEAMPKVASTASMAKVSVEELLAAVGTIIATTQTTASTAGVALRAIIANVLNDTNLEIEEGVTQSKEQLDSFDKVLTKYATSSMKAAKAAGELINPMEALNALAKAYKENAISEEDMYAIEYSLAGKLRINQLQALLSEWDGTYAQIMSDISDAAGSADKELDVMLGSWERKLNVLKNSWTEFISHVVDTEAIKTGLDVLTGLVYVLDSAFGKLLVTLGAVGAALYVISAHPIIAAITAAIGVVGMLGYQMQEAKKRIEEAYPELYALNDAIRDTDEAVKNAKASYADTVEETEAAAITASHYVDALRDLEKEGLQTEQSQNRYRAIVELLNELIPSLNLQIDETTGKLNQQSEAVLDNVDAWKEKAVQDALQQQYNEIYRAQADLTIEKVRAEIALEQERAKLEENRVKLAQLQSQQNQAAINGDREAYKKLAVQIAATGRAISDGEEAVQKYGDAIEAADGKSADYTEQLNELDQVNGKLKNGIDDVTDATQDNTDATKDNTDATKDNTDAKKENAEAAKSVQQETDALEQQAKAAGAALKDFEAYGNLTTDSMKALRDVMPDVVRGLFNEEGALNAAGVAAFETAGKLDSTTSAAQYLQAAANSAYYGNLITQIAQVGATAAVSAGQVVSLLSVIGGYNKNVSMDQLRGMERTAKEKGTTVQQEFSNYISAGNYLSNFKSQLASAQSEAAKITANHTKSSGSSKGSSGSSKKSGSSSSSSTKDERLESLKQTVEDAKAAYNLLEKQGAAEERLRDAAVAVQKALHNQAAYLRSISADQADIDELSADWWSWQEKINDSYGNAVKSAKNQLSYLEAVVVSEADAADHDQKRIEQMRVIQEELHKQADYLRSIGADKEEIKKLSIEWWQWEGKIRDILQQQTEELKKQAEEREKAIEAAEKAREQAFADADSDTLAAIKEQVALRQSELDLIEAEYAARVAQLEAERASEEEIQRVTQEGENKAIVKREEIRQWLLGQIKIMEEIGAKQTDINAAWTQYYKIGGDIQKQIKNVKDELSDIFKQLTADFEDELEAARDAIIEPLQQQIDLLKAAHDQVKDQREEEEKLLAVEKARKALYNVERNRNVRYYNADAGQWEWTWNAKELEQAQEDLRNAEKNLSEYYADRDYEIAINNLEEQVKMTNAAYDEFRKAWRDASKRIQDGSMSVEEAIALLREATTRAMDKYKTDLGDSFNKISAVLTTYENKVTELTRKQLERENLIGNLLSSTISSHTDAVREYTDELLRQRDRLREEAQQQYERDVDKANENYYPDSPTGKRYYSEDGFIIDAKTGRRVADEAAGAVLVDGGDSYRMGDGTTVDKQGEATRLTDAEAAAQIKDYGRQWREAYAAGDQAAMDAAHAAALGIGQSRGWTYDNGYWYYPNGTRVYDQGGILHGMGGIKATERDEAVLDPDTTAALLEPKTSFQLQNSLALMRKIAKEGPLRSYEMLKSGGGMETLNSMGVVRSYQAPQQVRAQFGSAGNVYNNGNSYTMNGVTIGEQQADAMTVRQFMEYVNGFDNLPLM